MVNTNADNAADFLLTNDAARYLDVSPQTIRVWERAGRLHAVRTMRGVRLFARADVTALLHEREARRMLSTAAVAPAAP
jgi:excisionase family DNA binding protein